MVVPVLATLLHMTRSITADDEATTSRRARIQYHRPGPDLAVAMECELCADEGISNPPGWDPRLRPPKKERPRDDTPPHKRIPPINPKHMEILHNVWDRVVEERIGSNPDSRLLALTCAIRAAVRGYAHLLDNDMRVLRLEDPAACLRELTVDGWLDTTPEKVLSADPMHPAVCYLPSFQGNPWQLGNGERARASGWLSRALSHRKMRKKPNRLRLTGAYLAAYSDPDGNIALPAEEIVQACSLSGPVELVELLEWLVRLQCITPPDLTRERVEVSLTEVTGWMAPVPIPAPTPPRITPASTPLDVPAVDRAHDLVDGCEAQVARWVGTYRDEHGHGPSWTRVCDAFGWPSRRAPDHDVTDEIFRHLREKEWLVGFGAPFALRPGPALVDHGSSR